jgi:hypothetical protein
MSHRDIQINGATLLDKEEYPPSFPFLGHEERSILHSFHSWDVRRRALCPSQNFPLTIALLNLLRKGLGRSKPPTLPLQQTQSAQLVRIPTISRLPEMPSIE